MATINEYGGLNDPLASPPLGGPQGWARAVADAVGALNTSTAAMRGQITAAEQKLSRIKAGAWSGSLSFAAGWSDVPEIPLPAASTVGLPGTNWKITATVVETHDGKSWYATVKAQAVDKVLLRVYNNDRTFAGNETLTVMWIAVCQ